MVLTLIGWLAETPMLAIAVLVWAIWVALLLSWWTYGGAAFVLMTATGTWGWPAPAALDAGVGALLVGYIIDCMIDPRADCWWCHGKPKRRNARSFFHLCLVCKGSGQRKRWGSKALARHRESAGDVT